MLFKNEFSKRHLGSYEKILELSGKIYRKYINNQSSMCKDTTMSNVVRISKLIYKFYVIQLKA